MKIKKIDKKPMIIHTKKEPKIHTTGRLNTSPKLRGMKENPADIVKKEKLMKGKIVSKSRDRSTQQYQSKAEPYEPDKLKISNINENGSVKEGDITETLSHKKSQQEVSNKSLNIYMADTDFIQVSQAGTEAFKNQIAADKMRKMKKVESGKWQNKNSIYSSSDKNSIKDTFVNNKKSSTEKRIKALNDADKQRAIKCKSDKASEVKNYSHMPANCKAYQKDKTAKSHQSDTQKLSQRRRLKFFIDKMQAEENQKDSPAKLVKDLVINRVSAPAKKMMAAAGGFLLLLVILISVTILPVVGILETLYSSPFAFFLPPLQSGDTVTTVASSYVSEFNRDINTLADEHTGYDMGKIVYVDYEGISPDNFNDIVAVYMVRYGVGDMATIMDSAAKSRLKEVVNDMCSYTTDTGDETIDNGDGTTVTQSVLYINVTLKSCYDMNMEYGFDAEQTELLEQMMSMFGGAGGTELQVLLHSDEIAAIVADITNPNQKQAVSYALSKVGYPYSQEYRDSGDYFDCSSLAYYSWQAAGINISYGGGYTAAAEAEGLENSGKTVNYDEIQPGDLIFYSYGHNGRYKDISHVAVYAGNGMVVEAKGTDYGVTYNEVPGIGNIVLIGRP